MNDKQAINIIRVVLVAEILKATNNLSKATETFHGERDNASRRTMEIYSREVSELKQSLKWLERTICF